MHFPECPISVFITSREGDSFTEYKQEIKGGTTTCYIESRPGQEWRVRLGWEEAEGQRGEYDQSVRIHVDGKEVDRMAMKRKRRRRICKGVRSNDAKSIRPFVFQTLAVGDSDDEEVHQLDEATVRGLGSIVVKLERGSCSAPREWTAYDDGSITSMDPLMVHEKMKKKTSEVTTLGEARTRVPHVVTVDFIPSVPPQSLKFKFLYRSAALLELEGIEVEANKNPTLPAVPVVPVARVAPLPVIVRPAWDPVAAEAEFHRLQDEIEAAGALVPALPNVKGKGKRDAAGADVAGKKIKLESATIVISDDDDDDDDVVIVVKKEVKKENIYRVKQETGTRL